MFHRERLKEYYSLLDKDFWFFLEVIQNNYLLTTRKNSSKTR